MVVIFQILRKIFPAMLASSVAILAVQSKMYAQDLPLIPIQSGFLQEKADQLSEWKKKSSLAARLPYFSLQSQKVALDQYLYNAKIFMLSVAVRSLFYPMKKLELESDILENNVFEFTKKYCGTDLKRTGTGVQLYVKCICNIKIKL